MKNRGMLYRLLRNGVMALILLGVFNLKVQAQLGPPPLITVQPLGLAVTRGGTAIMTVVVVSLTAVSYKWYHNGQLITNATTGIITIPNLSSKDSGTYYVEVRNASGTATSQAATLIVLLDVTPEQPTAVPISEAKMTSTGFKIKLTGLTASKCVIYASTNLVNWSPITTNTPSAGIVDYIDASALQRPVRFYKAMTQ